MSTKNTDFDRVLIEPDEPHDHWGRPIIDLGEKIMNLEKAYKNWQEDNPDEVHIMQTKRKLKHRTLQLWHRKKMAWLNKQKRKQDEES